MIPLILEHQSSTSQSLPGFSSGGTLSVEELPELPKLDDESFCVADGDRGWTSVAWLDLIKITSRIRGNPQMTVGFIFCIGERGQRKIFEKTIRIVEKIYQKSETHIYFTPALIWYKKNSVEIGKGLLRKGKLEN